MKYNVEILPAAWEDLKKIEDWYLINFDVETAIKVSDHILDGIERLGDFPDSGSRIQYIFITLWIRELNIRSYSNKEGLPVGILEGFLYA